MSKDLERDDPFELVAVARPDPPGAEEDERLARCLVEEYALAGFTAREVAALFESPRYTASHAVLRRRGPDFVRSVIRSVYRRDA